MSELSIPEWHAQFVRQARWTQGIRNQLYRRARLLRATRVLDVGCGTGVITHELAQRTKGTVTGLDHNRAMLQFAQEHDAEARYEWGDALQLPYPDQRFEIVTCHLLLLWVQDPEQAVREMARVTCRGGSVLICAEPDYGGRIDWPDLPIREWQIEGLRRQGADPLIGRQLRALAESAGLRTEIGVHPSQWDMEALQENAESEWKIIAHDVGPDVDETDWENARQQAQLAIERGTRTVYVPTFYALGHKV